MANKKVPTASDVLYRRLYKKNPDVMDSIKQERQSASIARVIYNLRSSKRMTQKEFAKRVGMKASAICRLEKADYDSQSLPSLRKIAAAFGMSVTVRLQPSTSHKRATASTPLRGHNPKGDLEAVL